MSDHDINNANIQEQEQEEQKTVTTIEAKKLQLFQREYINKAI